tara:strand:+ start:1276 stop:1596 length:321 start_codon:yes stop_codon:yes gene_type:complete
MSIHVKFVVPRDGRSMEVGCVNVSLKVFDPVKSLENLRQSQLVIKAKKAARSTIIIRELKDEPKQAVQLRGKRSLICKAVTLTGAPCKSKASCGAYCKRHFFVSKE